MTEKLNDQQKWHKLRDEIGEDKATQEVIRQLKQVIEYLEKPDYPIIFSANVNLVGKDIFDTEDKDYPRTFIAGVSVTLSYPWPG